MMGNRPCRVVDGERIEGAFLPIFIRNGATYHLSELKVFADGAIYSWEWGDLGGLRAKLESGRVATTFDEGARASVHRLASWRFDQVNAWITAPWRKTRIAVSCPVLRERTRWKHLR
ncbi:hypothetical protein AB0K18_45980 [Nonomuraea sp. NPDC049421]|uniref:DUF7638 domain-containing protein n=1 Tax=Nonomuraea sp. NPDC049421 TaxID=3155275 RepID=UPI00343DF369